MGIFEVYPNRDSLPYKHLYGLNDALTVMRGTYRNIGWCETLKAIVDLGLVDETPNVKLKGIIFQQMLAESVGASASDNIRAETAKKLNIEITTNKICFKLNNAANNALILHYYFYYQHSVTG